MYALMSQCNEIDQEKQINQDSVKQKADMMVKVHETEGERATSLSALCELRASTRAGCLFLSVFRKV